MVLVKWAAIWDLDGTMVDTSEYHFQAWCRLAELEGFTCSREAFEKTFGRRNPEIVRELFNVDASEDQVIRLGERKEAIYREIVGEKGIDLLPGVRELLFDLASHGYPQAVASSAPRANVELLLKLTNTAELFAAIVAQEDCTRGKPDPQVFLLAAQKLEVPPRLCVVLEDAVAGVRAAKAAGMKCIAVHGAGHATPQQLRDAGADWVGENLVGLTAGKIDQLVFGGADTPSAS